MRSGDAIAVITGCGVVSAIGIGRDAFGRALAEGRRGIGEIVSFDPAGLGRRLAAEIPAFDEKPFLRSPKNYLDRNSALAFAACEMAARESGLALPDPAAGYGLSVGNWAGNVESLAAFYSKMREKGPRLAPPFLFPHTYYNTTAGLLSIEYGLTGPHAQFNTGGAAGLEAVAHAVECIGRGRASAIFAGGSEAFSEWLLRASVERGLASPVGGGEEACLPFGAGRNGAVVGEAAAFFCIESPAAAAKRGARILARVLGCGIASSFGGAMRGALERARLEPRDVEALFAAAGGCVKEDEAEAMAVREVFGDRRMPTAALKGLCGETFGAAGALNLAGAIAAAERGVLPASSDSPFDWLDLAARPRPGALRTFLANAAARDMGACLSVALSVESDAA